MTDEEEQAAVERAAKLSERAWKLADQVNGLRARISRLQAELATAERRMKRIRLVIDQKPLYQPVVDNAAVRLEWLEGPDDQPDRH